MTEWFFPFLFALGAGVLSVWGVGGGTLLLVCMSLFLSVEQRTAQAINLLFFLPAAAIGLLFHARQGFLDKVVWRQAVIPGMLAAAVGATIALAMDVSLLRKPFGLFLLWNGASMLLRARNVPGEGGGGR